MAGATLAASHEASPVADGRAAARPTVVGWPLAVGGICFSLMVRQPPFTLDGFLDLVCGRLVLHEGIPKIDSLSAAATGRPWVDQQWLAQLAMYGTWALAGPIGLAILVGMLLGAAYAVLTYVGIAAGAAPQRAAQWSLVGLLGAVGYVSVRAELFSYLAFALVLAWLAADARRDEPRRESLWLLPVLVIWANVHGVALLGVASVCAYCGASSLAAALRRRFRQARTYLLWTLGGAGTLLATPYGFSVVGYYRRVLASSLLPAYENEWMPPSLTYPLSWMTYVLAATTVLALVVSLRRRRVPNPGLLAATLLSGALAFHAMRYQPWFAMAASALACVTLTGRRPVLPLDARVLRVGAVALAVAVVASAVTAAAAASHERREDGLARGVLASAARWAAHHPGSRILTDVGTSDRLLWWHESLAGRVGFDGRLELYDAEALRLWFSYVFGPGIPRTIAGTTYDLYVASSSGSPLSRKLSRAPCLRTIYADRYGIVAVARAAASCRPGEG